MIFVSVLIGRHGRVGAPWRMRVKSSTNFTVKDTANNVIKCSAFQCDSPGGATTFISKTKMAES